MANSEFRIGDIVMVTKGAANDGKIGKLEYSVKYTYRKEWAIEFFEEGLNDDEDGCSGYYYYEYHLIKVFKHNKLTKKLYPDSKEIDGWLVPQNLE